MRTELQAAPSEAIGWAEGQFKEKRKKIQTGEEHEFI